MIQNLLWRRSYHSIISQKTADSLKELKGLKIKPVVMTQAKATVIR
jgi:hypothetical protein